LAAAQKKKTGAQRLLTRKRLLVCVLFSCFASTPPFVDDVDAEPRGIFARRLP
jgi:hypothetical protein